MLLTFKSQPKQVLGYLPLAFALPAFKLRLIVLLCWVSFIMDIAFFATLSVIMMIVITLSVVTSNYDPPKGLF
jgi:hypothetical protein